MANRCTLHKTKLEDFKSYLNDYGIAYREGKGDYQILQVLTLDNGWQCIYERGNMPEHFTIQDKLMPVIEKYLSNRRGDNA